jgi:hypothetical protein
MPKDYTVSESITIKAPRTKVFDYLKFQKNQEQFSVWILDDPKTKMTYQGIDGTIGAIQGWESKLSGVGEQEITKIDEKSILVDLRFKKPFESNQKAGTIMNQIDSNTTEVISEFYGHDPYPSNIMSFIGKKMIKDAEKRNLINLKAILEK